MVDHSGVDLQNAPQSDSFWLPPDLFRVLGE